MGGKSFGGGINATLLLLLLLLYFFLIPTSISELPSLIVFYLWLGRRPASADKWSSATFLLICLAGTHTQTQTHSQTNTNTLTH